MELIDGYVAAGDLPDQSALRNNAVYIFMGGKDPAVPAKMTLEAKRYFEERGARVNFDIREDVGHWFPYDEVPLNIGRWCYDQLGAGIPLRDYHYEKGSRDYLDQGAWRRFD